MRKLGSLLLLLCFISASSNDLPNPLVSALPLEKNDASTGIKEGVVSRLSGGGGSRGGGSSSGGGGGGSKGGGSGDDGVSSSGGGGGSGGTAGGGTVNNHNNRPWNVTRKSSAAARIPLPLFSFLLCRLFFIS